MYKPSPIATAAVELPPEIVELSEKLAESTHDNWALGKLAQGYTYGEVTSDETRTHTDLVPYSELSEDKKDYDRVTAMGALKAIYALGYKIVPA